LLRRASSSWTGARCGQPWVTRRAGARDGAQGPVPARQVFVEMLERSFRGGSRSGRSGSFFGKGAGSRDASAHGPDGGKAGLEQNGAVHADDSAKRVPVAPKLAAV